MDVQEQTEGERVTVRSHEGHRVEHNQSLVTKSESIKSQFLS